MTVSGAYGRDYKTAKDMKADWDAGKDFTVRDPFHGPGKYVSKRDVLKYSPGEIVMGRFKQDRNVTKLQ